MHFFPKYLNENNFRLKKKKTHKLIPFLSILNKVVIRGSFFKRYVEGFGVIPHME
jgi:hypothetical protein